MENKELKIVPPEGYEIDREGSTFECIKFKKKEAWRRHNADSPVSGYYIGLGSDIMTTTTQLNTPYNRNIFATKKQAKSARAMAQISQIMTNDERFGGVVTNEEWKNTENKWVIMKFNSEIYFGISEKRTDFLAFHTREQRDLFFKENEDLVKDYLMVD